MASFSTSANLESRASTAPKKTSRLRRRAPREVRAGYRVFVHCSRANKQLQKNAVIARVYRLAKPAEVENEANPSSSRHYEHFGIRACPFEKRAFKGRFEGNGAPAGGLDPDVRRGEWPRSRPRPIWNHGLVQRQKSDFFAFQTFCLRR